MISPKQAARYCLDTYNTPANFDRWIEVDGVVGGIKGNIIAMRGSQVLEDFIRNVEGIDPMHIDGVGTVGTGFYEGVESFYAQLGLKSGDSIVLTGHSLGCVHAAYIARLAIMCGVKVTELIMFAPPRPGYSDFHDGLSAIGAISAYHNTEDIIGDIVPDVPMTLPDYPWVQFPLIKICAKPEGLGQLNPIDWHSCSLYWQGVPD